MKKFLILASFLLLSSCAGINNLKFDPVQYSSFVQLKADTNAAVGKCDSPAAIKKYSTKIRDEAAFAKVYVSHRYGAKNLLIATTNLEKMIIDLDERYTKENPSRFYCVTKLENISSGLEMILTILGRME